MSDARHPWWHWALLGVGVLIALAIVGAALGSKKDTDVNAGAPAVDDSAPAAAPGPPKIGASVQVTGDGGRAFTGAILDGDGSRSVQGNIPASFELAPARVYSVVFQEKDVHFYMQVTLNCNGKPTVNSTRAQYGVVRVTCTQR